MENVLSAVFTIIFYAGVIGAPVMAYRKDRDVFRWLLASISGLWLTAGLCLVGIFLFPDRQKLFGPDRSRSEKIEKQFCWAMIIGGALIWLVGLSLL